MKLKRRQKEERQLVKRKVANESEIKINKRKSSSSEKTEKKSIKIRRRSIEVIRKNKKEHCNIHSETKVIYSKTVCPLCEANKLIQNLCNTIDSQRKIIKRGFDEVYQKLLWTPSKDKETNLEKENIVSNNNIHLKRKRRKNKEIR